MHKTIAALAAAGLLLVAACGGDDDAASSSGGGGASGGGGSGGNSSQFCQQAKDLFAHPSSDTEKALDALDALHPPAQIAHDWDTLVAGTRQAINDTQNFDPNNPDAVAEMNEKYQDVIAAQGRVESYLSQECGISDLGTSAGGGSSTGSDG